MVSIIAGIIGEIVFLLLKNKYGAFFPDNYVDVANIAVIAGFALLGYVVEKLIKAD